MTPCPFTKPTHPASLNPLAWTQLSAGWPEPPRPPPKELSQAPDAAVRRKLCGSSARQTTQTVVHTCTQTPVPQLHQNTLPSLYIFTKKRKKWNKWQQQHAKSQKPSKSVIELLTNLSAHVEGGGACHAHVTWSFNERTHAASGQQEQRERERERNMGREKRQQLQAQRVQDSIHWNAIES